MIDLHNHILSSIDDGAVDLEESIAIARQFVSEGVERVAATPHVNPIWQSGPSPAEVAERVRDLQVALDAEGVPLTVLTGSEIHMAPDVPELVERGAVATLGGGKTVLVELPFEGNLLYVEDVFYRLQARGYLPILAHPERAGSMQTNPAMVDRLLDGGVAFQLTAASLAGYYGGRVKRFSRELLHRGAYALASSDRHHPEQARSLATLHQAISEISGSETADLLLRDNPARLLADQRPIMPTPAPESRRLGRWFVKRS